VGGRLPLSAFFTGDMSAEREIEYEKLVGAIFLEVFNRQK
jgi:hypothetical protein